MNVTAGAFPPNTIVRLKDDPGRYGQITNTPPSVVAGNRLIQEVNLFGEGLKTVYVNELEEQPRSAGPVDLLKERKFATPDRILQRLIHLKMNGKMADLIYSMKATNTEFHPYQFKPVVKMLNNPSGNLFIADEVGLGKTIEAGLIWTELRARFNFNRLFVLCPNALRRKWEAELSDKFGIDARIMDAEQIVSFTKDQERMARGCAIIGGIQSLRPHRDWRDRTERLSKADQLMLFLENEVRGEQLFNLLIIDESHHLKDSTTAQHELGRLLRNISDQAVFLSATPMHLGNTDLFSQLTLLDEENFQSEYEFSELLEANKPILRARDALLRGGSKPDQIVEQLEEALRTDHLSGNNTISQLLSEVKKLETNDDELTDSLRAEWAGELERANLLSHALTRTRRKDVDDLGIVRRPVDRLFTMAGEEQQLYELVTETVSQYAYENDINHHFLLSMPQRMLSSSMPAAVSHWQKHLSISNVDEDIDEDENLERWDDTEEKPLTRRLAEKTANANVDALEAVDTKFHELCNFLEETRKQGEKVIVFSTFRPTLEYLRRRLEGQGAPVFMIHGSVDERDEVLDAFRIVDPPAILLSSEIASEGLDLQFCRILVNYDLPWNPMRVEQRIGRIDRFGQQSDSVTIVNFLHEDTIDQRIYERLFLRLDLIKNALGEFEAVLGEEIRKLTSDLVSGRLTKKQEEKRIERAAITIEQKRIAQEQLEDDAASLIAHGDYILQQVNTAEELSRWITDKDLESYLAGFLGQYYPASEMTKISEEGPEIRLNLDSALRQHLQDYLSQNSGLYRTRLIEFGDHDCVLGKIADRSQSRKVEVINQTHPLVRFACQKFNRESDSNVRHPTLIAIDRSRLPNSVGIGAGPYVIAISKWGVSGVQSLEKLAYAMASLETGARYSSDTAEILANELIANGASNPDLEDALDTKTAANIAEELFHELLNDYDKYCDLRRAENEDRTNFQLKTIDGRFRREEARLEGVIRKHEAANNPGLRQANLLKLDSLRMQFQGRRRVLQESREMKHESENVTAIIAQIS